MKKYSTLWIVSCLVLMFTSVPVFAAGETKLETEQGGYLTLSNIVEETALIQDDPQGSDTAYISDGPVTLTMVGDDPHPTIHYYAEADIAGGSFIPSGSSELVEVVGNSVVLDKPGYYSGFAYFGPDFSFSSTAAFVIQVRDNQASSPTDDNENDGMYNFTFGGENSDYTIKVPESEVLEFQRIQYMDSEYGDLDITVAVIKTPELEGFLNLGSVPYVFETMNPDVSYVTISFESHFGGQVWIADSVELTDGKYESTLNVSKTTIREDIIFVRVIVYDKNGELLLHETGMNVIFDDFERPGYTITDLEIDGNDAVASSVSAIPNSSKVLVDREEVSFQAYTINSNNYFKLRDLAKALSGTGKSFEVSWDGEHNAITLESGKEYTVVGGELAVSENPVTEQGELSTSTIFLDGEEVELTAYLINNNNYFKLRDVASAIDFGVTWDGATNTIGIDSSSSYVPE